MQTRQRQSFHHAENVKHCAVLYEVRKTLICLGIDRKTAKSDLQVSEFMGHASNSTINVWNATFFKRLPKRNCAFATPGNRSTNLEEIRVRRNKMPFDAFDALFETKLAFKPLKRTVDRICGIRATLLSADESYNRTPGDMLGFPAFWYSFLAADEAARYDEINRADSVGLNTYRRLRPQITP